MIEEFSNNPVVAELVSVIETHAVSVSFVSVLLSVLAILIASRQVSIGKHANKISIHENRLMVYKGLLRLRKYISLNAKLHDSNKECLHFADIAEISQFYYPQKISTKLLHIDSTLSQFGIEISFLNTMKEELPEINGEDTKVQTQIKKCHALKKEAIDACEEIKNEMMCYLQIYYEEDQSSYIQNLFSKIKRVKLWRVFKKNENSK